MPEYNLHFKNLSHRDKIWEQIKKDKDTVYGKSMLEMFLSMTEKLELDHYEELASTQKKLVDPEWRLQNANDEDEAGESIKDGAKNFSQALKIFAKRASENPATTRSVAAEALFGWMIKTSPANVEEALNFAARYNNKKLMELTISRGAQNFGDATAWATYKSTNLDALDFLLSKGADIDRALLQAVGNRNIEAAVWIINKGVEISSLDNAFIVAAELSNITILRVLHDRGIPTSKKVLEAALEKVNDNDHDWGPDRAEREITIGFLEKLLDKAQEVPGRLRERHQLRQP